MALTPPAGIGPVSSPGTLRAQNSTVNLKNNNTNQKDYGAWYVDPNSPEQYNQGFTDLVNQGTNGWTADQTRSHLLGYGDQFAQTFKQVTGKDPTSDDFSKFYGNIVNNNIFNGGKGAGGTNYADVQNLINPYLSTAYGSDIQGYQQQQQQQHTQDAMGQAQGMVDQMNQNTLAGIMAPDSMAKYSQAMNRNGMLNSGAFSQGLGDMMAQGALSNQNTALQSVGLPGVASQMGNANAPYQQFLNNAPGQLQQFGQGASANYDFARNAQLMQQLQKMMQPTDLQQWGPIISGALQGGGMALSGH